MKQTVRSAINDEELLEMNVDDVLGGSIQVIPEEAPIKKHEVKKPIAKK